MTVVTPVLRAQIAKLRAVGYTNTEIAERLSLNPSTVSYQVQKMKMVAQKLDDVDDALLQFLAGAALGAGAVGIGLLLAKLFEK